MCLTDGATTTTPALHPNSPPPPPSRNSQYIYKVPHPNSRRLPQSTDHFGKRTGAVVKRLWVEGQRRGISATEMPGFDSRSAKQNFPQESLEDFRNPLPPLDRRGGLVGELLTFFFRLWFLSSPCLVVLAFLTSETCSFLSLFCLFTCPFPTEHHCWIAIQPINTHITILEKAIGQSVSPMYDPHSVTALLNLIPILIQERVSMLISQTRDEISPLWDILYPSRQNTCRPPQSQVTTINQS